MLNFCTLFDINYLSRGLALYDSLEEHCKGFHLYIFAFDKHVEDALTLLSLQNATVISLREFENDRLLKIKSSRTPVEYCWTCTPSTIEYILDTYDVDCCTYLDADLFFFASPEVLIQEMGNKSILITEHRYTPEFDKTETSGKYCVQFMTFKNTKEGRKALAWWRDACIEWCYYEVENNRFGDQKYLDDWLDRFNGVHVLQHLGGGVAPWNVQQYEAFELDGRVYCREIKTDKTFSLIFYHFHALQFLKNKKVRLSLYPLSEHVIWMIYGPYIKRLVHLENRLQLTGHGVHANTEVSKPKDNIFILKRIIKNLLVAWLRSDNVFRIRKFV